jgi:hypothetical protein
MQPLVAYGWLVGWLLTVEDKFVEKAFEKHDE